MRLRLVFLTLATIGLAGCGWLGLDDTSLATTDNVKSKNKAEPVYEAAPLPNPMFFEK